MAAITDVVIIFNPNSTGDSPAMAREFAEAAQKLSNIKNVSLQETQYAGHAQQLASQASKTDTTLVVSVSGDGGYHEVVNGVLQAADEGKARAMAAVLPGGNANDHYSSLASRPLIEALQAENIVEIDVIAVTVDNIKTYAHSYMGLGLTPLVAVELNRHTLSAFKELWLATKTFWKFRPFEIITDGRHARFDSLVVANIDHMAKYITIAEDSSLTDGKFEVISWPHMNKLWLAVSLLKRAFKRGEAPISTDKFSFSTVKPMPMQLDGEIIKLDAGSLVDIAVDHKRLRTLH
jgi:diacylglycerol kinase family enzyme